MPKPDMPNSFIYLEEHSQRLPQELENEKEGKWIRVGFRVSRSFFHSIMQKNKNRCHDNLYTATAMPIRNGTLTK